jgi:hypothetical protein
MVNTGFFVAYNNNETRELFLEWENITKHGDQYWELYADRWPFEQGAFNAYVRTYLNPGEFIVAPCNDANGFPNSFWGKPQCEGLYIQHRWRTSNRDQVIVDYLRPFAFGNITDDLYYNLTHKQLL